MVNEQQNRETTKGGGKREMDSTGGEMSGLLSPKSPRERWRRGKSHEAVTTA